MPPNRALTITSIVAALVAAATASAATRDESNTYDVRGRLAVAQYVNAAQAWHQSFGYDANDNWLVDATAAVTAVGDPGGGERFALRIEGAMPVREVCRIRYALPDAGPVEIALYDVRGRTVRTTRFAHVAPGVHVADVRLAGVAAGSYALRLRAGNRTAIRSLVIVH